LTGVLKASGRGFSTVWAAADGVSSNSQQASTTTTKPKDPSEIHVKRRKVLLPNRYLDER
jgi:hypothetical protein